VGHDQIDEFLEFAHGRARPATVRAYANDLAVFFSIVDPERSFGAPPRVVRVACVLDPGRW
jgi:hypothetical protein